jgi:hypothetical protein
LIDSVEEIDMNPYLITRYQVGDYVLRRYPSTKIGGGNPNKYGSWWRGPYRVMSLSQVPIVYGFDKAWYSVQNLVTTKEYYVDVTHIKPFYYDPNYTTPLNIATKDSEERIVERILEHNFDDPLNKLWLVKWYGSEVPEETWETHDNLKDVEAFHHYCAAHQLDAFVPKAHAKYSASAANMQRRAPDQYAQPIEPTAAKIGPVNQTRKRGRPALGKKDGAMDVANGGENDQRGVSDPMEAIGDKRNQKSVRR